MVYMEKRFKVCFNFGHYLIAGLWFNIQLYLQNVYLQNVSIFFRIHPTSLANQMPRKFKLSSINSIVYIDLVLLFCFVSNINKTESTMFLTA